MSQISRWSYRNVAVITPFLSVDMMSGVSTYGAPYPIACTWTAESAQSRAQDGMEFISRHTIFTEDARPKYMDRIVLRPEDMTGIDILAFALVDFSPSLFAAAILILGPSEIEEIRARTRWDMTMFDDVADYKLVT